MNMYHSGALLKLIFAMGIAFILYEYVNIFQQPGLALSFGFLVLFLVSWSCSYFLYYVLYKVFSRFSSEGQREKSYSLSLLTGMYVMLNAAMIVMGNRTLLLGAVFAVVFMLFLFVIASAKNDFSTL